jgi:hypothetical protein
MYIKIIAKVTKSFMTFGSGISDEQDAVITREVEKTLADKLEWYHKLEQGGIFPTGEESGPPLHKRINGVVPFAECPSCHVKQPWAHKKTPTAGKTRSRLLFGQPFSCWEQQFPLRFFHCLWNSRAKRFYSTL